MIYTSEIVGFGLLVISFGIAIWWFVIAYRYRTHVLSSSYTRGANVAGSDKKAELKCDSGSTICVYRATKICSIPQPGNFENKTTDPIANGLGSNDKYGTYNSKTTVPLTKNMGEICNGKTNCEYDFSNQAFPFGEVCPVENTQLIASYTCIPEGIVCIASP